MPVPRNRSDPWSATMLNPERGAEAWRSAPKHATNRPKRTLERHRSQRLEAPQAFVQSQRWSCSWDRGRAAHARLPRRTPLPATCLRRLCRFSGCTESLRVNRVISRQVYGGPLESGSPTSRCATAIDALCHNRLMRCSIQSLRNRSPAGSSRLNSGWLQRGLEAAT